MRCLDGWLIRTGDGVMGGTGRNSYVLWYVKGYMI